MTGTCWVRAEPNTRRTLQEPSREEHDCDDDDGNDDADERGILPGLVRHVFAPDRSWHEGDTTNRDLSFQFQCDTYRKWRFAKAASANSIATRSSHGRSAAVNRQEPELWSLSLAATFEVIPVYGRFGRRPSRSTMACYAPLSTQHS